MVVLLAEQSGLLLRPGVVVFRVPLALVIEHLLDEIELTLCRFQYLSSELHTKAVEMGLCRHKCTHCLWRVAKGCMAKKDKFQSMQTHLFTLSRILPIGELCNVHV